MKSERGDTSGVSSLPHLAATRPPASCSSQKTVHKPLIHSRRLVIFVIAIALPHKSEATNSHKSEATTSLSNIGLILRLSNIGLILRLGNIGLILRSRIRKRRLLEWSPEKLLPAAELRLARGLVGNVRLACLLLHVARAAIPADVGLSSASERRDSRAVSKKAAMLRPRERRRPIEARVSATHLLSRELAEVRPFLLIVKERVSDFHCNSVLRHCPKVLIKEKMASVAEHHAVARIPRVVEAGEAQLRVRRLVPHDVGSLDRARAPACHTRARAAEVVAPQERFAEIFA
jgi:hypothetical protein